MKKLLSILGVLVFAFPAASEGSEGFHAMCECPPFKEGEMGRFVAKIGPLKVGEGTALLQKSDGPAPEARLLDGAPDRKLWHVQGRIVSTKPVSLFYKVDDRIEAWMQQGSFLPYRQELRIEETNERAERRVLYDHTGGFTHFWRDRTFYRRKRHKEIVTVREDFLVPGSFDPISLLLLLRCVEADVGDVLKMPLHENGKNRIVEIYVEGIETIKTPLGRKEAIRAQIKLFFEGKLANKRPFIAWVSNDELRIPLKAVADLPFAHLKGVIVGYRESFGAEIQGELDPSFLDRADAD